MQAHDSSILTSRRHRVVIVGAEYGRGGGGRPYRSRGPGAREAGLHPPRPPEVFVVGAAATIIRRMDGDAG
jgi:hypothetical protein